MYSVQTYNSTLKGWFAVIENIPNLVRAVRIKEKAALNYPDKITRIVARSKGRA